MRSPEIDALAVDYDRTITDLRLQLSARAVDGLARARRAGKKVIVVSGRGLDFLEREVGHLADALVGENGCFLLHAGERRCLAPDLDLDAALASLPIEIERGTLIASVDARHEGLLRDALARAGASVDLIRNRDRVMVLPRGVDKARGVLAALDALGIDPARAAAAGDGENDVAMLSAVGYGVAVANAVDEVKAVARYVCDGAGGDGLARWIDEVWLRGVEARA